METTGSAAKAGALGADDWIAAAVAVIGAGGVGSVAVEPLARRLGVTKGSFYWHFKNRDALLAATLERWEVECTDAVIALVERTADPRQRLELLVSEAFVDPARGSGGARSGGTTIEFRLAFDLAIGDAADDPLVGPVLRRVSERRVDYLEACYAGLGFDPDAARSRAVVAYAAYLGTLRLAREVPSRMPDGEAFEAYQRHLIAALVPQGAAQAREGASSGPHGPDDRGG